MDSTQLRKEVGQRQLIHKYIQPYSIGGPGYTIAPANIKNMFRDRETFSIVELTLPYVDMLHSDDIRC